MPERTYSVRLSVEGEAAFRRALDDAGRAGSASLKRIEAAAQPASFALRGIDSATRAAGSGVDSLASRAGTLGSVLRGLGPGGLFTAAAVGGFLAIASAAKSAMAEIAALGDMADRAGFEAGLFERLQAGLIQTGQKTEGLEASLRQFSRTIGEAQTGTESAVKAFERLGVAVANADGSMRSTEDVLRDVADRIAAVESPAERVRIAVRLFGEQGTALLPMLSQGAAGMDALAREAERLGLLYGGDVIRNAQALNAEFDKQMRIVGTQLKSAFVDFAPVVVSLAQAFAEFARVVGGGVAELAKLLGLVERSKEERAEILQNNLAGEIARLKELEAELAKAEERAANPAQIYRLERGRLIAQQPGMPTDRLGVADQVADLRARVEAQRQLVDRIGAEITTLLTPSKPVEVVVPDAPPPSTVTSRPGGGKIAEKTAELDEFERKSVAMQIRIEALRRVVEGTAEELGALFLGNDDAALKGYEAQLKVLDEIYEARRKGVELTPAEIASIEERARLTGLMVAEDERALKVLQDRRAEQARAAEELAQQNAAMQSFLADTVSGLAGAIAGTERWSDALRKLALSLSEAALQAALLNEGPLKGLFGGGLLGGLFGGAGGSAAGGSVVASARGNVASARGNVIVGGELVPFARGGVPDDHIRIVPFARGGVPNGGGIVEEPILFPMRSGRIGLMGEAGREAILPMPPNGRPAVYDAASGAHIRIVPFARGGVPNGGGIVEEPILFPMRSGRIGLMGEAGREAILPMPPNGRPAVYDAASGASIPLARDALGRLGVDLGGLRDDFRPQPFAMGGAFADDMVLSVPPVARVAASSDTRQIGDNFTYAPVINAEAGVDMATIEALLARQYRQFKLEAPNIVRRTNAETRRSGARL